MRITFPILAAAAVVVLVLIVGYFAFNASQDEALTTADAVATAPAQPAPAPAEEPAPEYQPPPRADVMPSPEPEPLPAPMQQQPAPDLVTPPQDLADSDAVVKQALQDLSPKLTQWLIPEEQVRKWVLTVDLVAEGKLPKRYRPLDYPMKKFAIDKQGDTTVADDANYARLQPLLEAVTAIDPQRLAAYYRSWKPLLQKAYQEQGKPGTFEERLLTAFSQLLAVTPLEEKQALTRPTVLYRYSDESLEKANDIEKLGWRMGEENLLTLQNYVRELRQAIEAR